MRVDFVVNDAALWYPNGMGDQPLYEIHAVLEEKWEMISFLSLT